jgi:hypothetical protein
MKTLTEMDTMCGRILTLLEHDDLPSATLTSMSGMLSSIRGELSRHVSDWRADGERSPELQSAEDALRHVGIAVLWLQENGSVRPMIETCQKLRKGTLHALRVLALLQHARPAAAGEDLLGQGRLAAR